MNPSNSISSQIIKYLDHIKLCKQVHPSYPITKIKKLQYFTNYEVDHAMLKLYIEPPKTAERPTIYEKYPLPKKPPGLNDQCKHEPIEPEEPEAIIAIGNTLSESIDNAKQYHEKMDRFAREMQEYKKNLTRYNQYITYLGARESAKDKNLTIVKQNKESCKLLDHYDKWMSLFTTHSPPEMETIFDNYFAHRIQNSTGQQLKDVGHKYLKTAQRYIKNYQDYLKCFEADPINQTHYLMIDSEKYFLRFQQKGYYKTHEYHRYGCPQFYDVEINVDVIKDDKIISIINEVEKNFRKNRSVNESIEERIVYSNLIVDIILNTEKFEIQIKDSSNWPFPLIYRWVKVI